MAPTFVPEQNIPPFIGLRLPPPPQNASAAKPLPESERANHPTVGQPSFTIPDTGRAMAQLKSMVEDGISDSVRAHDQAFISARRSRGNEPKDFMRMLISGMNAGNQKAPVPEAERFCQPPEITTQLDDRQIDSVLKGHRAETEHQRVLICDEMGIGKTLISLALIMYNRQKYPSLIIVPPHLLTHWKSECTKHLGPEVKWIVFAGRRRLSRISKKTLKEQDIIVTTYTVVQSEYKQMVEMKEHNARVYRAREAGVVADKIQFSFTTPIGDLRYGRVYIDEAQCIKNPITTLARACASLTTDLRGGITGSPLWTDYTDYYGTLGQFMRFPLINNIYFFRNFFLVPDSWKGLKWWKSYSVDDKERFVLAALVWSIMTMHKAGESFGKTGPATTATREQFFECTTLTKGQAQYQEKITHLMDAVKRDAVLAERRQRQRERRAAARANEELLPSETGQVLKEIHWAREACIHEDMPQSGYPDRRAQFIREHQKNERWRSPRIDAVTMTIEKCLRQGRKTLVFAPFVAALDMVGLSLDHKRIRFVEFHGQVSDAKRTEALAEFKSDAKCNVLLMSIKSGGAGLDITAASAVIFMCPEWAIETEYQAVCHALRRGQEQDTVMEYFFWSKGSIEVFLGSAKGRKEAKKNSILNHHELTQHLLEVNNLLRSEYYASVVTWAEGQIRDTKEKMQMRQLATNLVDDTLDNTSDDETAMENAMWEQGVDHVAEMLGLGSLTDVSAGYQHNEENIYEGVSNDVPATDSLDGGPKTVDVSPASPADILPNLCETNLEGRFNPEESGTGDELDGDTEDTLW